MAGVAGGGRTVVVLQYLERGCGSVNGGFVSLAFGGVRIHFVGNEIMYLGHRQVLSALLEAM